MVQTGTENETDWHWLSLTGNDTNTDLHWHWHWLALTVPALELNFTKLVNALKWYLIDLALSNPGTDTYGRFHPGRRMTYKIVFFLVLRQNFFSVICLWNFLILCVSIDKYPGEVQSFLFLMLTCWTWLKQPRNLASKFILKFGVSLVAL